MYEPPHSGPILPDDALRSRMETSDVQTIRMTEEGREVEDIMRRLKSAAVSPTETNLKNYFEGEGRSNNTKESKGGGKEKKKKSTRGGEPKKR